MRTRHDEIAWLAERFNVAATRIETLVGAHRTLLAIASHELRSPLARIRMALEMLDRGDTAKARSEITRDISELDQLIEEILLASRLDSPDAPQEPFEEIDLTALVAEGCARTDADLNVDGVIVMQGSPRLLRRLIRNLLENARHHGGEATAIDVSLANKDKIITLAVCDRGPACPRRNVRAYSSRFIA